MNGLVDLNETIYFQSSHKQPLFVFEFFFWKFFHSFSACVWDSNRFNFTIRIYVEIHSNFNSIYLSFVNHIKNNFFQMNQNEWAFNWCVCVCSILNDIFNRNRSHCFTDYVRWCFNYFDGVSKRTYMLNGHFHKWLSVHRVAVCAHQPASESRTTFSPWPGDDDVSLSVGDNC